MKKYQLYSATNKAYFTEVEFAHTLEMFAYNVRDYLEEFFEDEVNFYDSESVQNYRKFIINLEIHYDDEFVINFTALSVGYEYLRSIKSLF